jgi:hypothetical protein
MSDIDGIYRMATIGENRIFCGWLNDIAANSVKFSKQEITKHVYNFRVSSRAARH